MIGHTLKKIILWTDDSGQIHTLRRVDNNDILLVSDEPVNDGTMSDKVI
jgi:hypothetical protein